MNGGGQQPESVAWSHARKARKARKANLSTSRDLIRGKLRTVRNFPAARAIARAALGSGADYPAPGDADHGGMDTATAPEIEIFRAGRHVDMHGRAFDITRADLEDIAHRYDPARHEAPLVIGHPQTNAPAYGWVKGMRVAGDVLLAQTHQIDPAFAEGVRAGRYKKRSASFLLPAAPDNPAPGQYYLNHVGFLGAAAPAVKGLRDAQFADAGQCAEFAFGPDGLLRDIARGAAEMFRRLRDWLIERDGVEAADRVLPAWQLDALADPPPSAPAPVDAALSDFSAPFDEEPAMPNAHTSADANHSTSNDLTAREQALEARATQLLAREQALAAREAEAARAEAAEFVAAHVASGQVLPAQVGALAELLLAQTEAPLNFAASDGSAQTQSPAQILRQFIEELPVRVDYREKAPAPVAEAVVAFAAPPGATVDPVRGEQHNKAVAYMQQHPGTPYLAAVKAIGG